MKPRVDITAVAITDSYEQVKQTIIRSGFSRIPVYEGDLDNIKGTLYVKDLLSHIDRGDEFGWQQLIRRPYFVPEHKKINDLLADFQNQKIHMAIVVDEYGSTQGLVSLEDIVEEVVGEISDESDKDEVFYTRLDKDTYLFDGKTHIGDFERIVEIAEGTFADVKGRAETLAGLMLELKCDFLKKGGYGNGSRCAVHCGGDRGTPHRQDQSPSAWIISFVSKKVLSWERLLRLVPERDLRLAAALKPASRREEFLMWRSIVYRRLPDAEIAYNAVGGLPSYAIILSISEFPTAPDTLRSASPTVHVPSISSRLPAISVGRQSALLLPKSGSCPTVRCCCRPSGAPRRRFTNIRGGGTSICSGIYGSSVSIRTKAG